MNVQGDVHREVLEFMLRRGYTDANPQFSQDRAGEVIDKLVMADLVEKRDDGRGNLLLSPTLRGAKLLRTANLPPRPIEVFLRDMAKHKVAIVATILGISSGAIAVYEFLRERFTNH
ncbi:MAG: hypothetical protein HOP29_09055 [Phycisphaerales bacterium]|nr:hypothetical protein [Phycisphaerales bacterium]